MLSKTITVLTIVLGSVALVAQPTPAAHRSPTGDEFPAVMRQNVAAGKTPVGTKVEAKLVVATLLNGTVIPKDAILSGEVTESVEKTATDPSRLAIRMDSVQWKNGSAPIKVYLTPWYYPPPAMSPQNLSYGPTDAEHTPQSGMGKARITTPSHRPTNPRQAATRIRTRAQCLTLRTIAS